MMRLCSIAALLLLTGCTSIPVGSFSVCVGVCKITIKAAPPQTTAEKAGAVAGSLLSDWLNNRGGK